MIVNLNVSSEVEAWLRTTAVAAGDTMDALISRILNDAIVGVPGGVRALDGALEYEAVPPIRTVEVHAVLVKGDSIAPLAYDPVLD